MTAIKALVEDDTSCDLCDGGLKSGSVFYDARIPAYGQWAWCCESCAKEYGVVTGTGKGQMYDSKSDVKVEG